MLLKASSIARGKWSPIWLILFGAVVCWISRTASAQNSVNLTWTPSASTSVTNYTVYYGVASGQYTNSLPLGITTNVTISGLSNGVTYYFAATSVDDAGLESDYSMEVSNTPVALRPPPATPPTISAIANLSLPQNSSSLAVPFTIGDAQVAANSLIVWAASTNTALLPTNSIVLAGTNDDRTISLVPLSGHAGDSDITVYVSDGSLTSSIRFHVTVLAASPASKNGLTLIVSGKGKISPNLTTQKLPMGRQYSISAIPSPGQMFCGWSGNSTSSQPLLTFVMKSNLVFQANFAPLNLTASAGGTLSPDPRTAQNLLAGKSYTVTAIPAAGELFAGWSGAITSAAPRITIKLGANLNLRANFVPNPYIAAQGTYNGLFYEDATIRTNSAGSFTIAVTSKGAYSGTLQIGSRRLPVSGQLDLQCQATKVIPAGGGSSLTLSLSFGAGEQAGKISGTVTDGNWSSALVGDRAFFDARTHAAPYAGAYTLILPGSDGDPSVPAGHGYGTVRVSTAALASFSGTLADGTAVQQSATVSKDGFWPLYIPAYSGQGLLIGWLAFTNQPQSDLNGLVHWVKPAVSSAPDYPAGFVQDCQAAGSRYVQLPRQYPFDLKLTKATMVFAGGNLSADLTNAIAVGPNGSVKNQGPNTLTLSFSATSGTFKGQVTDPATGKSFPFGGAVLQKQNAAYGFLSGTNQSSGVSLTP